ncbi:hypothetical protein RhiirA1_473401 [Rhizophagus irregularis]|uniref:Uncharacterized protein n=1 Tax=Rhizophagus irregularis TaxID=588596 RepID=A0A2N0R0P7_9GLOM|nr:hypothetical protein RhiirA1_473401 [Rhizophagus irregularis]
MSSKNDHEQRTPYVQKKPQKLCLDCKEKNDCSKIEEVINNFHENHIKPNKKIRLDSGSKRIKKKPPKHCQNCKEMNDCVKLFLNKTNRLEGIVGNFRKNLLKKTNNISIFRAKFTLNSVPCELEYDLSHFTLESLQKLADCTTQNCTTTIKIIVLLAKRINIFRIIKFKK